MASFATLPILSQIKAYRLVLLRYTDLPETFEKPIHRLSLRDKIKAYEILLPKLISKSLDILQNSAVTYLEYEVEEEQSINAMIRACEVILPMICDKSLNGLQDLVTTYLQNQPKNGMDNVIKYNTVSIKDKMNAYEILLPTITSKSLDEIENLYVTHLNDCRKNVIEIRNKFRIEKNKLKVAYADFYNCYRHDFYEIGIKEDYWYYYYEDFINYYNCNYKRYDDNIKALKGGQR